MSSDRVKYFILYFSCQIRKCGINGYTFEAMKLMTVKEYAEKVGKSIPLIYKQIRLKQVETDRKFGRILIKTKE